MPRKPRPTDRTLIGYARVSTIEQNLEMQKQALLNAGVHPDALHVEHVSGASANRPVLEWALDELREGDTFCVWKLDRIARSLTDLLKRMEQIKQSGANFRSLTEDIDTNTASGRLLFHVMGAIAEFERDLIRERTKAGVRAAMERGVKFGPDRKLNAKQIAQAQKMRDAGKSLRTVAKHFGVSHTLIEDYTTGARRFRKK